MAERGEPNAQARDEPGGITPSTIRGQYEAEISESPTSTTSSSQDMGWNLNQGSLMIAAAQNLTGDHCPFSGQAVFPMIRCRRVDPKRGRERLRRKSTSGVESVSRSPR